LFYFTLFIVSSRLFYSKRATCFILLFLSSVVVFFYSKRATCFILLFLSSVVVFFYSKRATCFDKKSKIKQVARLL
jgi:4-hydroxybenzoate polyprenyltransferase